MSRDEKRIAELLRTESTQFVQLILNHLELDLNIDQPPGHVDNTIEITRHLEIFAACFEYSTPCLLADYLRWGNGLSPTTLQHNLEIERVFLNFAKVSGSLLPKAEATAVQDFIDEALEVSRGLDVQTPVRQDEHSLTALQNQYFTAILAADRMEAGRILIASLETGVSIEDIYLRVLQPTQHQIGSLWQVGELSVAQEHYCTAATQFVMSQLQPYFLQNSVTGSTMIATCVGDELHEIGLRFVSDLFELEGWNSIYLGANTPVESVATLVAMHQADVLAISTTMTNHLRGVDELIQTVRSRPGCESVKILVGGYPFNIDPQLWQRLQADGCAPDAKEAIQIANRLISPKKKQIQQSTQDSQLPEFPAVMEFHGEAYEEMSRLNNELITVQRQLMKTNLQFRVLNEEYCEKAKRLEELDRQKDEFLAMLAHELRGPLEPINHALAILELEKDDPTLLELAQETIKRQVQQMARLIHDLLDTSRIAHGKLDLQIEPVELKNVIERAVETAQPLAQEKHHQLLLQWEQPDLIVLADEIRLAQVISNLLTNAVKYTDEKGTITLKVTTRGSQAVIIVEDNGIGISPDLLPNIFETFQQEARAKKMSRGGLGLGLRLVRDLVALHQGTVKIDSEGIGKGCKVELTLPLAPQIETPSEALSTTPNTSDRLTEQSPQVLIVDDAVGLARMTKRLFELLGYQPLIVHDGEAAVQEFRSHRPQIVVVDLILPGMNGFEILEHIQKIDPENETLTVILTGNGDDANRQRAQELAVDMYFVKPVDIRDLRLLKNHPKMGKSDSFSESP